MPRSGQGGFSELEFYTNPDAAEAQAMLEARRRALRRGRQAQVALALTPGFEQPGGAMLRGAEQEETRLSEAPLQRLQYQQGEERLAQGREQLGQGRWQPVSRVNPVTGEMVSFMVDTRTGEVRDIGGALGGAPGRPLPPRMTEAQMKMAAQVGTALSAFPRALQAGLPESGAVAGTSQALQQMASRAGFPSLAGKGAIETDTFWYGVVAPIINAQTGQQMSYQEYLRRWAGYAPRPGEPKSTQRQKVHQLVDVLEGYLVGLPQQVQEDLGTRLQAVGGQARKLLGEEQNQPGQPPNLGVYPLPPPGPPQGPQPVPSHQPSTSRSGRPIFQR